MTELVDYSFRHEYGKLVAALARLVGSQYIELVEDAAQFALMTALESWSRTAPPDNPPAWLYQVARNQLLTQLRQTARRSDLLKQHAEQSFHKLEGSLDCPLANELQDDLLRMLFHVCHDKIPVESQLVFALKTLCGFSVEEIAVRLFMTQANVYKRLGRARQSLKKYPLGDLTKSHYLSRLTAVNNILYVLFTEGYLSSSLEQAIRQELCDEAIRLATLVAQHNWGAQPETYALLALMHLHAARSSARLAYDGELLLLEQQDRSKWDQNHICLGLYWIEKSAQGRTVSRYHAEAGIAAEHCLAQSFKQTRWAKIAEYYAFLERISSSPVHKLNQALAIAELEGSDAGLAILEETKPPEKLRKSYIWNAVLADLYRRSDHLTKAALHHDEALQLAPTSAIKRALIRRFQGSEP